MAEILHFAPPQFNRWRFLKAIQHSALAPAARHVAIELWTFANAHGECFPSQGRIAQQTGLGRRTVQRALSCLCGAKVIVREPRFAAGRGRTSDRVRLTLPVNCPSCGVETWGPDLCIRCREPCPPLRHGGAPPAPWWRSNLPT